MFGLYRSENETKIDEELFNAIYQQYRSYIYKIAISIVKQPALAEEIMHDVFIKIINNFDKFASLDSDIRRKGWLVRVTRNTSFNIYNKEERSMPEEDCRLFSIIDEEKFRRDTDFDRLNFILDYIDSLPIQYRAVMEYYYLDRYTANEIALKLGLSVKAVEKRLSRGRQKLRDLFNKER